MCVSPLAIVTDFSSKEAVDQRSASSRRAGLCVCMNRPAPAAISQAIAQAIDLDGRFLAAASVVLNMSEDEVMHYILSPELNAGSCRRSLDPPAVQRPAAARPLPRPPQQKQRRRRRPRRPTHKHFPAGL